MSAGKIDGYEISISINAKFYSNIKNVVGKDKFTEKINGDDSQRTYICKQSYSNMENQDIGLIFKSELIKNQILKRVHL